MKGSPRFVRICLNLKAVSYVCSFSSCWGEGVFLMFSCFREENIFGAFLELFLEFLTKNNFFGQVLRRCFGVIGKLFQ